MASSRVAFEKFEIWKNSRTVLNLTVWTNEGVPDNWHGRIISVEESRRLVGFVDDATRDSRLLDLTDASFVVKAKRVEASRLAEGKVTFAELLVM